MVVGTSMGGYGALQRLVSQLTPDFPGCLCVVLHVHRDAPGVLARVLARAGPLEASTARDGDPLRPGHIYVAPPDHHLVVKADHLTITKGPKENRSRPSIDVTMRSAGVAQGPRSVGVLLTGLLDDGVAGLGAIRRCGGATVVQDPADAEHAELPQNAIDAGLGDHTAPLDDMGELLTRLAAHSQRRTACVDRDLAYEVRLAEGLTEPTPPVAGELAPFTCIDCNGPLWEQPDGVVRRYRCHVGHAITAATLLAEQGEVVEEALWVSVRMLEGRAAMLERMAIDAADGGRPSIAAGHRADAQDARRHASALREVLFSTVRDVTGSRARDAGEGTAREAS